MLILLATTLVVCAPGYPGSATEAQPAMDAFAKTLAGAANLSPGSFHARYEETDAGGMKALAAPDAQLVLATLPFFLAHEEELQLTPRLMAVEKDSAATQQWTLVSGKDAKAPLAGYALQSSAGSTRFAHAMAPQISKDAPVASSGAVLSGLRRASAGEKIALLLDGPQAAALGKLPFADKLTTLGTSPSVPVAVIATVGKRLDDKSWQSLGAALATIGSDAKAREALDGIQMSAFVPVDEKALAAARAAWQASK